jgi:uncharacterized membrane protein YbhN (UPF0104 family)
VRAHDEPLTTQLFVVRTIAWYNLLDIMQTETSTFERDAHRLRNGLISTAGLLVLALAIGLAVPDLREVLDRIAHAAGGWLVLGVALEIASCLGYVATVRLVLRRGPAANIRWLAWAEQAFGAVVPVGGAGGLAVGAWAMRAWGLSWERIANRSAVIFLLTSAVNAAVLAVAGIAAWLGVGSSKPGLLYGLVPAVVGIAAIALFLALPRIIKAGPQRERGGRLQSLARELASWSRDTEVLVRERNWRLLGALGYLLFDIAVLWACLRAVGETPPVMALVLGYQLGYLANLIPIPGGIGVLEGGLLGALLLYGLPAGPTAAAVILYHAIALWIPTLGGTFGFVRLRPAVHERAQTLKPVPAEVAAAPVPAVRDLAA